MNDAQIKGKITFLLEHVNFYTHWTTVSSIANVNIY